MNRITLLPCCIIGPLNCKYFVAYLEAEYLSMLVLILSCSIKLILPVTVSDELLNVAMQGTGIRQLIKTKHTTKN